MPWESSLEPAKFPQGGGTITTSGSQAFTNGTAASVSQSASKILDDTTASAKSWVPTPRWYERDGIMRRDFLRRRQTANTGLEVIANQLGKKLDEDNPVLNAQLPDGSRLAAVIPPVVRPSPALTIRKFTSRHYTVDDLINRGTLTRSLTDFLAEQIRCGKTLLISGGTGTGKTTLLRILADFIPEQDRIVSLKIRPSFTFKSRTFWRSNA